MENKNTESYWMLICRNCGKSFKSPRAENSHYCSIKCARIWRADEMAVEFREKQFKGRMNNHEFEVVEDALHVKDGGFKQGALISRDEMVELLANRYITQNTVVLHRPTGQLYHVDYSVLDNNVV